MKIVRDRVTAELERRARDVRIRYANTAYLIIAPAPDDDEVSEFVTGGAQSGGLTEAVDEVIASRDHEEFRADRPHEFAGFRRLVHRYPQENHRGDSTARHGASRNPYSRWGARGDPASCLATILACTRWVRCRRAPASSSALPSASRSRSAWRRTRSSAASGSR